MNALIHRHPSPSADPRPEQWWRMAIFIEAHGEAFFLDPCPIMARADAKSMPAWPYVALTLNVVAHKSTING